MPSTIVFVSSGDPSGDVAAARLLTALSSLIPTLDVFGLGGEQLRQFGQRQLAEGSDLAVLGFYEVARRYPFFRRLLTRCVDEIRHRRPAAVILVDYPGFNLRLAARVKFLGIPVIYYIAPQVWAWGARRVNDIKRDIDLMLVILPFEEQFFRKHGVTAHFVGHYLLDEISREYVSSPIPARGNLCLLPGSRPQEIMRMLPTMLASAQQHNRAYGTKATIAAIKGRFDYESCVRRHAYKDIQVSYEDSRRIIHESALVLAASGTATLETAIIGRPMIVIYKTGFITYHIARRLVRLDNIALANLVLGEKVVPELIQSQAYPERILSELSKFH
ncbi:MAG TPA: lipid-A-disaccharide synthase, partial [Candidatus Deferrimicrobium sp.]|nr:lipid-A-disaccharide synthase [Candidatus Deferrimicrobium sp.]